MCILFCELRIVGEGSEVKNGTEIARAQVRELVSQKVIGEFVTGTAEFDRVERSSRILEP